MKTLRQTMDSVALLLGEKSYHKHLMGSVQPWYDIPSRAAAEVIFTIYQEDEPNWTTDLISVYLHRVAYEHYTNLIDTNIKAAGE